MAPNPSTNFVQIRVESIAPHVCNPQAALFTNLCHSLTTETLAQVSNE